MAVRQLKSLDHFLCDNLMDSVRNAVHERGA
jgi:hypothetical protein